MAEQDASVALRPPVPQVTTVNVQLERQTMEEPTQQRQAILEAKEVELSCRSTMAVPRTEQSHTCLPAMLALPILEAVVPKLQE